MKKKILAIIIVVLIVAGIITWAIMDNVRHQREIQEWVESTDTYKEVHENLDIATEAAENAKKALDELKEKENYYKTLYPDLFD